MEEVLEDLTLPTGRRGEGLGSQCDGEGADLLASLESEMEQEVAIFLENMWEEVEPEAGHRLREADAQVRGGREEGTCVTQGRKQGLWIVFGGAGGM
jgi:hypothetical protein